MSIQIMPIYWYALKLLMLKFYISVFVHGSDDFNICQLNHSLYINKIFEFKARSFSYKKVT